MTRTKFVKAGAWRTLESFWNASGTAFFREPGETQIKVRYGDGSWLGWNSQKQTLDGVHYKALRVGGASVAYARMQIRVSGDIEVTYDVYPGDLTISGPAAPF